jgi:hypothetical protein
VAIISTGYLHKSPAQFKNSNGVKVRQSWYLQISKAHGNFWNIPIKNCTLFVEMPENNLAKAIRKLKLARLYN